MVEPESKSLEEKDLARIKLYKEFEDGHALGTVDRIHNVNVAIWRDFKKISRVYANSEGAAFTACVQSYMRDPANKHLFEDLTKKGDEDE